MGLNIWIVDRGVQASIEAWSTRLTPLLLAILLGLIIYVLLQPGAMAGLHTYLVPDFDQLTDPALLLSAMGQRSEEHTSELQSRGHLVCRLLLEKKKLYAACSSELMRGEDGRK